MSEEIALDLARQLRAHLNYTGNVEQFDKMVLTLTKQIENQQYDQYLRKIERLLRMATMLKRVSDQEAESNKEKEDPEWVALEEYEERVAEIEVCINPGRTGTGLQIGWDDTHGHVLYSD